MVQMADQVRAVLKGKNEVTTMTLQNLALAYWRVPATQGRDLLKSAELLEEVEGMFEVLGQVQGQLSCWNSLISLLVKAGRPSEAAKWTEKLMDYATISEDHDLIGMHGVFLGEALVSAQSTDNAQLAIPFLERALAASTKCEGPQADNDLRMKALAALGCAYMDLEQFDKALETTTLSVSDMEARNDGGGIAGALRRRAMIYSRMGQFENAATDLQTMLQVLAPGRCPGMPEAMRLEVAAEGQTLLQRLRGN